MHARIGDDPDFPTIRTLRTVSGCRGFGPAGVINNFDGASITPDSARRQQKL
ncbi:hypothetical protein SAXI111661_20860 [Saccharomonospora xinjiangensis]|nr:hypothetical protein EYD13_15880 [Saccharomonospora xinjiangensis]